MKPNIVKLCIRATYFAFLTLFLLAGCTVTKDRGLYRISGISYPRFMDDMGYDGLEDSIRRSIEYLEKFPPEKTFMFDKDPYSASHMIKSLQYFLDFVDTNPSDKNLKRFIIKFHGLQIVFCFLD